MSVVKSLVVAASVATAFFLTGCGCTGQVPSATEQTASAVPAAAPVDAPVDAPMPESVAAPAPNTADLQNESDANGKFGKLHAAKKPVKKYAHSKKHKKHSA